jgi:SOS-response transcriptional repressor LexA
MSELASLAGCAHASGYQRYEDPAMFKERWLPVNLIRKLLPILVGRGSPPITEAEVLELAQPVDGKLIRPARQTVPVIGRVAAGLWQEDDQLAQEPTEHIPFTRDMRYPDREQYALKVDGESMNLICPHGSYVVVVKDFGRELAPDDIVIVQKKRGGLTERTLKRFKVVDGIPWLYPESRDPKYKPIALDGDEDTEIEIEGYALGSYTPFRRT